MDGKKRYFTEETQAKLDAIRDGEMTDTEMSIEEICAKYSETNENLIIANAELRQALAIKQGELDKVIEGNQALTRLLRGIQSFLDGAMGRLS